MYFMIKAIIFDLDGVLIESEKLKAASWKRIFQEYGIDNGDEWYISNIGMTRLDLCKKAIQDFSLPATAEELYEKKIKTYSEILENAELIDSAINFLKSIPRDKYKIGLAASTNKIIIEKQMKALINHFDVIVSGEDEVTNNKPDPEIYLLTAKKLGINRDECVAIEDSSSGLESAKNAGMKCIVVSTEYTKNQDFSKADIVVDNMSELSISQIEGLNNI